MDSMDGGSAMPTGPGLSDMGLDMSNLTVASAFLAAVLDDDNLQPYDWALTGVFWYGIVIVVTLTAFVNLITWLTLKARIRAAAAKHPRPAQPSNLISSMIATTTAIVREISYPQITPTRLQRLRIPPFGSIILVLTYLGFILGLEFYDFNYPGAQYWEALGLRASWLTVAQFPLLILLAGKNNLIGLIIGISYERLQILHRWVARVMLLTASLHGAYQTYGWSQYGVLQIEISTDSCIPTGFATWILLLWLVFSATAPFRNLSYEFFVVQHVISFIGFLVAVFYHIPSNALNARIFIWLAIGFFALDRLTRLIRSAFNNSKPGRAILTELPGGVTKISVRSPRIKSWKPAQHVFLSIPRFGVGQSHPATIASVPSSHSNELVFFLRAHKGFTKRVLGGAASASTETLLSKERLAAVPVPEEQFVALVDGPYGASYSDFAAFDTTVLVAGSTGVTFTLPILLDIAYRASTQRLPLRSLVFIWMIKNTEWAVWIVHELQDAVEKLHAVGIEVEVKIYVTCDPSFTEEAEDTRKCGCDCDVRQGPCCCDTSLDDGDNDDVDDTGSRALNDAIAPVEFKSSCCGGSNPPSISDENPDLISPIPTLVPSTEKIKASSRFRTRATHPLKDRLEKCSTLHSGRPNFKALLWDVLDKSQGETGIAVCGPPALSTTIRNTVSAVSDQRGANKGTGAGGVYLHSECYYW